MNVTVDMAQAVVQLLEQTGAEASVEPEYSGRGMFGRTAVGIVTDASPVSLGVAIGQAVAEGRSGWRDLTWHEAMRAFARQDNMGFDRIHY